MKGLGSFEELRRLYPKVTAEGTFVRLGTTQSDVYKQVL